MAVTACVTAGVTASDIISICFLKVVTTVTAVTALPLYVYAYKKYFYLYRYI